MKPLSIIKEATRQRQAKRAQQQQTQTQTAEPGMAPDMSAFQRDMDSHAQGTQNVPQKKQWASLPKLKQSTAVSTRQKTANVALPPAAAEKLSFLQRLGLEDEITDVQAAANAGVDIHQGNDEEYGRPEPRPPGTDVATIQTMPDVVNKEIATFANIEPEWHQVRNLPGYLKGAIRSMGRQVFGVYTKTPIEDIQIVANLGGQGPNSERELNAVAGWLHDNAERDTKGEMNFQQSIPDYGADFQIYTHDEFTFMLVDDEYGKYVYSWPSKDNKSMKEAPTRKKLR